jgi:hypothetical protein
MFKFEKCPHSSIVQKFEKMFDFPKKFIFGICSPYEKKSKNLKKYSRY